MKGIDNMSNSSLVNYTKLSPNRGNYINGVRHDGRTSAIKKITIHHMACNGTLEAIGEAFAKPSRQASSNYAIDSNGRVAMYCEEVNRSWCSGNAENDNQAITIEVANDGGAPNWHVSDKALAKLIELCVDICKRNNIKKLNFTGDINGNLTMHKYFQPTQCPGPYLESKFSYIADEVNKRLNPPAPTPQKQEYISYKVQKGDSWWQIAQNKLGDGNRYMDLVKFNGYETPPAIYEGNIIKIPCAGTVKKPTVTETPKATQSSKKSIDEIAKEVVQGKWGNGNDRKQKLIQAGYDYATVQAKVNQLLKKG